MFIQTQAWPAKLSFFVSAKRRHFIIAFTIDFVKNHKELEERDELTVIGTRVYDEN